MVYKKEAFIQSQHSQNCIPNSTSLNTSVPVDLRLALIDVSHVFCAPFLQLMKSEAYLTKRLVNLFLVTGELGTFCHRYSDFPARHKRLVRTLLDQGFRYGLRCRKFKQLYQSHHSLVQCYSHSVMKYLWEGVNSQVR